MISPPYLKSGDRIAIVATARWITTQQAEDATRALNDWGLEVVLGQHVFKQDYQLAGTMEDRLADLQWAMDDPSIQGVLIARGGYGTVHLLDQLNWNAITHKPKWIAGYSDITGLLAECIGHGIAAIHSTMPVSFHDATPEALLQLKSALFGNLKSWSTETKHHRTMPPMEGILVGGNLSVIYSLMGSKSLDWLLKPTADPFILFLEDVDEMHYHIDRMMMGLLRAGYLKNVGAICLGGLTLMRDNTQAFGFATDNTWGADAVETVVQVASRAQIPVIQGWQAGHLSNNQAFYVGRKARLLQNDSGFTLNWAE
ncbi:MAG: LD-carboxypeptidase [Flavobacteriales bacterium]